MMHFLCARWEAWLLRASSPRGLPFRETLHMLLRARLGLSVSTHLCYLQCLLKAYCA